MNAFDPAAGDAFPPVTLCESFLLLAHYFPERQELAGVSTLNMELNGAALAELAMHERIVWSDKGAAVVDKRPLGDPLLDRVLLRAGEAGFVPYDESGWSTRFTSRLLTGQHTLNRLLARGVLRFETRKRFLGAKQVVVDDGRTRQALADRLLRSMLAPGHLSPFDATLIFVWGVTAGGMEISDRRQRKAYEQRYDTLFRDLWGHMGQDAGEMVPGLSPTARRSVGELVVALGINTAEGYGYEGNESSSLVAVADSELALSEGFMYETP